MSKYVIIILFCNLIMSSCKNNEIATEIKAEMVKDSIIIILNISNNINNDVILQSSYWQFEGIEKGFSSLSFFPINDFIVNSIVFYSKENDISYRSHKEDYPDQGNVPKLIKIEKDETNNPFKKRG